MTTSPNPSDQVSNAPESRRCCDAPAAAPSNRVDQALPASRVRRRRGSHGNTSRSHRGSATTNSKINPNRWLWTVADDAVGLTRSEFDLLLTLMKGNCRVITKNALAAKLQGEPPGGWISPSDRRAVEVHMADLRRKLNDPVASPNYIETVSDAITRPSLRTDRASATHTHAGAARARSPSARPRRTPPPRSRPDNHRAATPTHAPPTWADVQPAVASKQASVQQPPPPQSTPSRHTPTPPSRSRGITLSPRSFRPPV
jgi:hypothetical protein